MSRRKNYLATNYMTGQVMRTNIPFVVRCEFIEDETSVKLRNTTYKIGNDFLDSHGNIHKIGKFSQYSKTVSPIYFISVHGRVIEDRDVIMKVNKADNIDIEKQVRRFLLIRDGIPIENKQDMAVKKLSKLEELELKIKKEEPIRVQGLLRKRKETLERFITKFFMEWNDEHDTIYVSSRETQTESGCRRSIGDIYLICSYYYPKCTLKEVWTILNTSFGKIEGFRSSICSQIKKRVYYYDSTDKSGIYNKSEKDEYGMVFDDWLKLL